MIDIVTKNVKQIGTPSEEDRIYVCDEAYRRIHATSFEEKRVFVFMGHTENYNGKYATFIEAAIPVANIEFNQGIPVWNNKTWSSVFAEIKRSYEDSIIVGWALDYKGYAPKLTPELEFVHKEQFGGIHQLLMISDSIENEEYFYINKGKHLSKKSGFFIYYKAKEKPADTEVKVDIELPEEFGEWSDNRERRSNYRELLTQKKKQDAQSKILSYMLTAAVAAVIVAFGLSIINGKDELYSKSNSVKEVSNIGEVIDFVQSTENITDDAEQTMVPTTETVVIPVENVEGEIPAN